MPAAPTAARPEPATSVAVEWLSVPSPVCAPPLGTAFTCGVPVPAADGALDGADTAGPAAEGLATEDGADETAGAGVPSAKAAAPESATAPAAPTETSANRTARRTF
jgi:hypothetical protein